jgi:GxxExxY protein
MIKGPGCHTNDQYLHSAISNKVIAGFYETYNELGYGFLESVYEEALFRVLQTNGLHVQRQLPVPIWFRGEKIGTYFADLLVNGVVIVELKAAHMLEAAHEAQLLNYLRATSIEVGLLLNFGPRPAIRRLAFSNDRKAVRVQKTKDLNQRFASRDWEEDAKKTISHSPTSGKQP